MRASTRHSIASLLCAITAAANLLNSGVAQETVDRIKTVDKIVCGVNVRAGLADMPNGTNWEGLSIDLTKALAAAVLGDANKVSFVSSDRKTGPEQLAENETELYFPIEPMTPSKLASSGFLISEPFFFNVQKVMVAKDSGVAAISQLRNISIAVQPGYVSEQNTETANEEQLRNYFRRAGWQLLLFPFQEWDEMESAFLSGRVVAVSAEETELARLRAANREQAGEAVILPEAISMVPVRAVVRSGDLAWLALLNATISVLIEAETLGVFSDNTDSMKSGKDPEICYLLGVTPGIGKAVGLDDSWGERVIKAVGNYGQIFNRNLGTGSSLAIPRGLNELWNRGGLLYPGPIR